MKRFYYNTLKERSQHSLSDTAYSPKKLVAISAGVPLVLSLLMMLLDWLLAQQIGTTGGLDGLNRRALLSTVQSALRLAQLAVLPFWSIGYTFAMLELARDNEATPSDLLQGFRKWGPVLRLTMLRATMILALGFVSAQIGTVLFVFTPMAAPLMETILELSASGADPTDPVVVEQMMNTLFSTSAVPLLICILTVFLVLYFLTVYRFRFAELCLMENPSLGAMRSLFLSARRMKGSFWAMLRLDLRLWWYHGLTLLTLIIVYTDILLGAFGIVLPMPAEVSALLFAALGAVSQFWLCWWRQNEVTQVYTHAFLMLSKVVPAHRPY